MKDIIRIHLAKTPYSCEFEAKKALERYLEEIDQALGSDAEMLREIELRIVELLTDRGIPLDGVVTFEDVEAIKEQLGAPSEFLDDEQEVIPVVPSEVKRLMRDSERGMLGGVCAGIAHYFGVNVLWPRLMALLLIPLTGGAILPIYIVLWLVIPVAKTAADRLQMRGEPVTLAGLRSETESESVSVPSKSKPLIIMLRAVLGLMGLAAALVAVLLVAFVLGAREGLLNDIVRNTGFMTPSIIVAFVSAVVAGVLFVTLMMLAAYAGFAWIVSRRMVIAAGAITVLGLVSFGIAVGFGVYGVNVVNEKIDSMQASQEVALADLAGVKKITVVNNTESRVEYTASTGVPRATIDFLEGQQRIGVKVDRSGDGAVRIVVDRIGACHRQVESCDGSTSLAIRGPAVDELHVAKGSVSYVAESNALKVRIEKTAVANIRGSFASLDAVIRDSGSLEAAQSAARRVNLVTEQGTSIGLGVVEDLSIEAPVACGMGSVSRMQVRGYRQLKVNEGDVPMVDSDSFYDRAVTPCFRVILLDEQE